MASSTSKPVSNPISDIEREQMKRSVPSFRVGDTVRVHARIREGGKERIQVFEGLVIRRHAKNRSNASFTVRKISYNIGVERTFLLHSPMIEQIEIVSVGQVRRARLYYLRALRGKAARIKSTQASAADQQMIETPDVEESAVETEEVVAPAESAEESRA